MSSDNAITKDMKIGEAISRCPESAEIFERHGMGCYGCMIASSESIEDGALAHGADVEQILAELNSVCTSKE